MAGFGFAHHFAVPRIILAGFPHHPNATCETPKYTHPRRQPPEIQRALAAMYGLGTSCPSRGSSHRLQGQARHDRYLRARE
eukprot:3205856-Alexandrium_andersonii.AAC.1